VTEQHPPTPRDLALQVFADEADAIQRTAARLDEDFDRAVAMILDAPGRVVLSGIGKSGLVAQKVAATMASTGIDAVAIHPVDALHGDLGAVRDGSVLIGLSASGTSEELLAFARAARDRVIGVIAVTGNESSPLALLADCVLIADAPRSEDVIGVLPTGSVIAAIALGDALAMASMRGRGVTLDDLARNHPAGAIGASLSVTVGEIAHPLSQCAVVSPDEVMSAVLVAMTAAPLGAALVMADGLLLGVITDGDLRRGLQDRPADFLVSLASQHMTTRPRVVGASARAIDALRIMEAPRQIYVLPVVDDAGRCTGLVRMHDLMQRGLSSATELA